MGFKIIEITIAFNNKIVEMKTKEERWSASKGQFEVENR